MGARILIALFLALSAVFRSDAVTAAPQPSVLVTGANRGIGLEFVKQYAAKGWRVIATVRRADEADQLRGLAEKNEEIRIETLDVTNGAQVAALAEKYRGQPIDVLINNAGVSGDFRGPSQSFGTLDYADAETALDVNTLGPLRVSEAFYENVKASTQRKIVAITALLGVHSFKYGGFKGGYWYKVSKAAMNAAMFNLAQEAEPDGVIVTLITPGEVAVEKVENPGPNYIKPEESIRGMINVIEGLKPSDAGAILRYNGTRYEF